MSCQGNSDDEEKGPITHAAKRNILKVDKATGQSNYCHHFIIWMKFRVKVGSQNFNFLGRSQLLPPGLYLSILLPHLEQPLFTSISWGYSSFSEKYGKKGDTHLHVDP